MDFSEVSNIASQSLDSSSCDSSVSETSSPPTKKRRANFEYDCFKTFDTIDAARDFVKSLGEFVYKKRTQNSDGDKLMYVCKSDSLCSSRLYIQLPATSTIVNVHKTNVDHDHQPTSPLPTRLHGIPMSTKSAIQELYSLGVTKPKQILRALVDKQIETPGTTQLNNYLKRLRQANTVPIDHLGALQHHIDFLSTSSDDDDEPFVLHKQFNYDDSTFGIFFTTNRLLSLIRKSDAVNIDATYKLVLKWNQCSELQEFIQYFAAEYIEANPNWFAGAAVGFPKTNNGVEGTNNWIKTNSTLRQKLPLNQFLSTASNLVKDWSIERDIKHKHAKPFFEIPSITTQLATLAYMFSNTCSSIVKKRKAQNGNTIYFIPSSSTTKKLTDTEIDKYIKNCKLFNYRTFDTFVKHHHNRLWIVTFVTTDWLQSTCTCPIFYKHYICKHMVGLAIVNNLYDPPPEAKATLFQNKRRPGRPSKSSKALVID